MCVCVPLPLLTTSSPIQISNTYHSPQFSTHSKFKHMEIFKKTQNAELLLVAAALLVIITPLLSTASLRSVNLYLVVKIIIIAVAEEAGLFSFFLVPEENKKPAPASVVSQNPVNISGVFPYRKEKMDGTDRPRPSAMATQVVENRSTDKVFGAFHEFHKDPRIFFIGGGESTETEAKYVADDRGEEIEEVISGQELFQKAEIFIGNFYQQLNIQREESWKKLHDFTQSSL